MNLAPYVQNVRRHTAELKRRNARAQSRARADLPRLTDAIKADPRVRRAYLFGSLAKDKFHANSDIDIAVEGLNLFERDELRQQLETRTEFRVDVRDLNSTPHFRDLVQFYGELLHAQPDDLRVLRKEIEADQAAVRPLADELRHARATLGRDPTQKDLAYLAYLLHGIYNAWESAMHRIAVLFENRLDPAQWHAQLLRRMSLDLPKIRPALITDELRLQLEKLRSFRHFFRHSYGAPLRKPELDLVLASYDQAATPFDDCLSRFLDDVKQIADQSEEP